MNNLQSSHGYTMIRRHIIILVFKFLKFLFLMSLAGFLYWIDTYYVSRLQDIPGIREIFFIFIFIIVNYAFFTFSLGIIKYYYNLIVIYGDQIVLIKCTLLMRDDMEVIDSYRIMKVDGFTRGVFANILGYGNLVIEQQKNDVRTFHFVPKPYEILLIIKKQREEVLNDRKRKYLVSAEDEIMADQY